ncbi:MAG: EAL domain-containing protein [Desulfovibrionales bacterium]|nr:MAG: EAL domain-containing protein [Desulfovibrionales bacterium]
MSMPRNETKMPVAETPEFAVSVLNDMPLDVLCHDQARPDRSTPRACSLMRSAPYVEPTLPLLNVYETFRNHPEVMVLPVVQHGKPIGLINRNKLHELFSQPFTRELHGRKPISLYMGANPVIVDENVSIDDLARIIIDAGMQHMYDGFILTKSGKYVGIGNGHDLLGAITERKQAHLFFLAHYDALTDLPNRLLFKDRLSQACRRAERNDHSVALMFLDLDRFKLINDTLGHSVGDRLLKSVAARLLESVRKKDTVSRLGGDEFTIILDDVRLPQDASVVARKILENMSRPFLLEGREVVVTTSIGVALYPQDAADPEELQKNSDAAMYHAKENGKNNFQFFKPEMNVQVNARLSLESYLRKALENEELRLHYQPQVELSTGRVVGVEALLRWQHPEMGFVSPLTFIPLAEELGLMSSIGEFVLREACRQSKQWQDELGVYVCMAVNLAGWQLEQPDFPDVVRRILAESGLNPRCLELELTENVLMQNIKQAQSALHVLGEMGVLVAIDDFGTGYSSLSYLLNLPIDTLKIDKCFIQSIGYQEDGATIATAVIALARSLKLSVVAEGVETAEQREFLSEHGCDFIQGYHFCRPLPPDKLVSILREHASLPTQRQLSCFP